MSAVRVALVLVSHSDLVARGTVDIAEAMAPDVTLVAAGGDGGRLGTSVDRVLHAVTAAWDAIRDAGDGSGVVVLTDLGSAVLTTDAVLELLDDDVSAAVRAPAAPLVEGAVAAAVQAQLGGGVDEVAATATAAGDLAAGVVLPDVADDPADAPPAPPAADVVTGRATLVNPLGLQARPAAVLARAVGELGVPVRVDGANGASVLELLRLGAAQGRELTVTAQGPGAAAAVDAVVTLLASGFGEV